MFRALAMSALLALAGAQAEPDAWKAKMNFAEASRPYIRSSYVYNSDGYVNREGKVVLARNAERSVVGLGCSSFASVVLQRMRYGASWKEDYDLRLHTLYGNEMARRLGLTLPLRVEHEELAARESIVRLVREGRLKEGALYFFDVRKGAAGHVGFVVVGPKGFLGQSHFSSMSGYDGHAAGDFRSWYRRSRYRRSPVKLYLIAANAREEG